MATPSYNAFDDEQASSSSSSSKPKNRKIVGIMFAIAIVIAIIVLAVIYNQKSGSSSDPFASLAGYCSAVPPISDQEFAARRTNMVNSLIANGYNAYVTEPGASMTYFSNVAWSLSERPFLLVIMANSSIFFLSPMFEEARAQERVGTTGTIVSWLEDDNPYDIMTAQIFGSPTSGFRVAMDPETRGFIPEGMRTSLGASNTVEFGYDIIKNIRMIKSPAEINIMRCVNMATKAALHLVQKDHIRLGMTEDELSSIMTSALSSAGLTPEFAVVLFAANAAFPHGTNQKLKLQKGDLILIDTGGSIYGYNSDCTRTFPYDESQLTDYQRTVWNTVKAAQTAALNIIIPGAYTCAQLDAAARQVVGDAGFGYNYENFTHRLGHGIALQVHEEPYNVRGNNLTLQPGMMFSIEPGIYLPGVMGVRHEDVAVVTSAGYEVFGPLTESLDNPVPAVGRYS